MVPQDLSNRLKNEVMHEMVTPIDPLTGNLDYPVTVTLMPDALGRNVKFIANDNEELIYYINKYNKNPELVTPGLMQLKQSAIDAANKAKAEMPAEADREGMGSRASRGQTKLRLDLISSELMIGLSEILTYGALKYAPNNWRKGLPYSETIASLLQGCILIKKRFSNFLTLTESKVAVGFT